LKLNCGKKFGLKPGKRFPAETPSVPSSRPACGGGGKGVGGEIVVVHRLPEKVRGKPKKRTAKLPVSEIFLNWFLLMHLHYLIKSLYQTIVK
jgi:hypothetical protein